MAAEEKWSDDARLVARCLRGDEAAWEGLVRRYRRLIFSAVLASRLPVDDAEEVFQRVVVKLFENLPRIRRHESLPAWLMTTARRETFAAFRENQKSQDLELGPTEIQADPNPHLEDGPAEALEGLEAVRREHALALAMERLDADCRALLEALFLENEQPSYAEIARRLGRPVGSLGPTRLRCLDKLRKLYLKVGGNWP